MSGDNVTIVPIGKDGKGLAICFSKEALIKMKEGGTFPVDLVTGNGKVKLMFMRDRTFAGFIKKFQAKVVKIAAAKESTDVIADAAELGMELGNADGAGNTAG